MVATVQASSVIAVTVPLKRSSRIILHVVSLLGVSPIIDVKRGNKWCFAIGQIWRLAIFGLLVAQRRTPMEYYFHLTQIVSRAVLISPKVRASNASLSAESMRKATNIMFALSCMFYASIALYLSPLPYVVRATLTGKHQTGFDSWVKFLNLWCCGFDAVFCYMLLHVHCNTRKRWTEKELSSVPSGFSVAIVQLRHIAIKESSSQYSRLSLPIFIAASALGINAMYRLWFEAKVAEDVVGVVVLSAIAALSCFGQLAMLSNLCWINDIQISLTRMQLLAPPELHESVHLLLSLQEPVVLSTFGIGVSRRRVTNFGRLAVAALVPSLGRLLIGAASLGCGFLVTCF